MRIPLTALLLMVLCRLSAMAQTNTAVLSATNQAHTVQCSFKGAIKLSEDNIRFVLQFRGDGFKGDRDYFLRIGDEIEGFKIVSYEQFPNPRNNPMRPFLDRIKISFRNNIYILEQDKVLVLDTEKIEPASNRVLGSDSSRVNVGVKEPDRAVEARFPNAGEEFQPAIGQETNIVSAREVRWTGFSGLEGRAYVYFAKGSRHAIAASSTNQVCFLKGKLFAVETGIQSFSLLTSRPIEATELTAETAIRALENVPQTSPRRKEIDLATLLQSEKERHLAQPLFLHSVQLRAEEGMLIVEFDSCTHLKGKVVLDDKLNVISMTLLNDEMHSHKISQ